MTRVLVAYSSKSHATEEIAETIAIELQREGIDATSVNVDKKPDVREYDAVVLGSALYFFRWRGNAIRYGRRHARALRERPVWLFSSGPFDRSAEERDIPPVRTAQRMLVRLHARGHKTFGGRASTNATVAALEKEGKETDYRNFMQVRAWARGVAGELLSPRPPAA